MPVYDYSDDLLAQAIEDAFASLFTCRACVEVTDSHRDALIDIAHDCGTLEAAQRRAREALKS